MSGCKVSNCPAVTTFKIACMTAQSTVLRAHDAIMKDPLTKYHLLIYCQHSTKILRAHDMRAHYALIL